VATAGFGLGGKTRATGVGGSESGSGSGSEVTLSKRGRETEESSGGKVEGWDWAVLVWFGDWGLGFAGAGNLNGLLFGGRMRRLCAEKKEE
jgi:hypothetical protein